MRFGVNEVCHGHDPGDRHPENPRRISAIRSALSETDHVEYVEVDKAPRSDVLEVHDREYVDELESFARAGGGNWDPDTVASEGTFDAALGSAGIAEWVADTAVTGEIGHPTPFSLGRPPGHHAVPADAMGFCFFNNVAIATASALRETSVERVGIVDWDVHHGNGTQDIFEDRSDVFYVSFHEDGIYPGTGDVAEIGRGPGERRTMNVPFPPGSGDGEYDLVIEVVIEPAMLAFDPDLLLVSAGFDAHHDDPISRISLSTEGFGLLADRMRRIAMETDAGLGFVLEGGYGLDPLAEGVTMVHRVFEGGPVAEAVGSIDPSVEAVIEDLESAHGVWWE
ncbi:MAG: histone deacetylase family protein [Halodesulfurarchaeum sp.]